MLGGSFFVERKNLNLLTILLKFTYCEVMMIPIRIRTHIWDWNDMHAICS